MRGYRYELLLIGVFGYLGTVSFAHQFLEESYHFALRLAAVALLLLGLASLRPARPWFVVGLGIAFAAIACNVAVLAWPTAVLTLAALLTSLAFMVLVILVSLGDVLFGGAVDRHKIVGAVCVYLLVGVAWVQLYILAEVIAPGSFVGLELTHSHQPSIGLVYFSFVTLTTLGYGDISPVSSVAQMFAWSEAVFGQLYLTVLVAALVGMHVSSRAGKDEVTKR